METILNYSKHLLYIPSTYILLLFGNFKKKIENLLDNVHVISMGYFILCSTLTLTLMEEEMT